MGRFLAVAAFIAVWCVSAPACAAGDDHPPRRARTVLVLNSERADLPSVDDFVAGFRRGLSDPGGTTGIFVEYLDFGRFPSAHHAGAFARYLRDRYAGRAIDAVVPVHGAAWEFVLEHRAMLFPDAYIIAAGVEQHLIDQRRLPDKTWIVPVVYDYGRTLALARALQPGLEQVVVVHGTSDYDLRRLEEAKRALETLPPGVRYRMLGSVPVEEIEAEIRTLSSASAVLLLSMVRDAEGRPLVGRDYAQRLAQASPAPVYGTFRSHLEQGTVGGAITEFGEIGRTAASLVSQALSGRLPPGPVAAQVAGTPWVVNWLAIEKWKIRPDRVPPDAQVLFREPGLWDTHRAAIAATLAVVALQGLLITGLMLQLRHRRRAESALAESEERLRLGADAARLGMWGWNASRAELWVTDNCRALHGLPPGERVTFEMLTDAILPEDRERFRSAVRESLRSHQPFVEEYRVAGPAGPRWIAVRGRGFDGGAQPSRAFGACADVSDRRELQRKQQELEHIVRVSTMGEIAASLAHELSQPLGAILANAQAGLRILDSGKPDEGEIREILQDVVADDKRAGEVIATLRTMLRKGKTEATKVDLARTCSEVLALLNSELVMQQVEVRRELEPGFIVMADKTRIEQVILNLVMNAVDAMRQQPLAERRLGISAARGDEGMIRLSIRDSGSGIPADRMDSVFDAFWTTKELGMGMGLAVCRSIVESWGGRIWAEANRGPGVTFSFTVPAAVES